jgi:hypothetical protein
VRDHCLDRVWQDAEVHGALLWIRWATGASNGGLVTVGILSNGGKSPQARVLAPRQSRPTRSRPSATRAPVPLPARTAGPLPHRGRLSRRAEAARSPGPSRPQPPPDRARRPRGALLSTPPGDRAPALPSGSAPPGPAALPRPLPRPASAPGPRRRPSPTQPAAATARPTPVRPGGPPPRSDGSPAIAALAAGPGERSEGWPQARAWCPIRRWWHSPGRSPRQGPACSLPISRACPSPLPTPSRRAPAA